MRKLFLSKCSLKIIQRARNRYCYYTILSYLKYYNVHITYIKILIIGNVLYNFKYWVILNFRMFYQIYPFVKFKLKLSFKLSLLK